MVKDREAGGAAVHGAARGWMGLSDQTTTKHTYNIDVFDYMNAEKEKDTSIPYFCVGSLG